MARRKSRKQDWTTREVPEPISKAFVDQYLETALWATLDENGEPLDRNYGIEDFSEEAVLKIIQESNDFIASNRRDLEAVGDMEQHGHDFFLTRNGHGAGFWDRGYGEIGTHLTRQAKRYGESDPYVGDDGLIYF